MVGIQVFTVCFIQCFCMFENVNNKGDVGIEMAILDSETEEKQSMGRQRM